MSASVLRAYRASILHFTANPAQQGDDAQYYEYFGDGLLVIKSGHIRDCGDAKELLASYQAAGLSLDVTDYSGKLIMPGFIDTHTHYPQTDVIGSYGTQLLDWLNTYTFPMEARFADLDLANDVANFFCDELLRNGTTTAMVFATVHENSIDAIFNAANSRDMRLIAGKVMMDRNAPENLCDTAQISYQQSRDLIQKWHGKDRLSYAITPRFAPTSTEKQLELAGQLFAEFDDVYLQSHVAENTDEVAWVKELFPWSRSYLDVYDHYGLLGKRAMYAHCIYLDEQDRQRMADTQTAMAFCPTSNLFLGSGLFDMNTAQVMGIPVGMATDVGGGTSFSMLQTLNEAYKVLQMNEQSLSPFQAFYQATLGSAQSLQLEHKIGNFEVGKEADFIVLDLTATPLMERRMAHTHNLKEQLFALMILGSDRNIQATYTMGESRYQKHAA
ncbi:guanine deaminase [Leucothrix pacifica]|uniref:Guanine deaminase n=1 Tax=Leucothrix pacifica TaxID=1247513 RepID=A0A317CDY3_9GAMM|nr:guanine deaminase [Leucothrix pacifica]PWQ96864.1 guanine deaminase [Leucothrix pacifica]